MSVRLALILAMGLVQSRGCGFEATVDLGPGEPCSRSSECRADLVCSAGVCATPPSDGGGRRDAGRADAGGRFDAGDAMDAAIDASVDASGLDASPSIDAAATSDASVTDADVDSGGDG